VSYPLWSSVHDWLVRSVPPGVTVIKRDQDGNLPGRPFVTAKVIAEVREGHPEVWPLQDDGTVTIVQGALFTISVQVFGNEAFELAHGIQNALNKITVQDFLRSRGMAYVQVLTGPEDLATVVGTGFEGRAHLDVQMRAAISIIDDVGIIERVELTGTIESVTYEQTIGV
jgi:hypothetical protein